MYKPFLMSSLFPPARLVGLISLFNMIGRFFWASTSDYIGRRNTYMVFFVLGIVLYALVPYFGHIGSTPLFVAAFCIILSMYGGGFATIPAYLRDVFGTFQVGAIHGRLLTAWSAAGVLGPVLVNYIRAYQIDNGVPKAPCTSCARCCSSALSAISRCVRSRKNIITRPRRSEHHQQEARHHERSGRIAMACGGNSVIVGSVENA